MTLTLVSCDINDIVDQIIEPEGSNQPDDNVNNDVNDKQPSDVKDETQDSAHQGIVYDDFQVHFLELGNEYAGDCTYIKAGKNDILIDAGSRRNSAMTIKEYVDKFCTDGKLEYVIATHAHQEHIAGFVGSKSFEENRDLILKTRALKFIKID